MSKWKEMVLLCHVEEGYHLPGHRPLDVVPFCQREELKGLNMLRLEKRRSMMQKRGRNINRE